MKDFSIRKSSCYDNALVALLAKDLKAMRLKNPFEKYDYPSLLKKHFWNGRFFYDDLTKQDYVAGDANVFPFVLGIIQDEEMLKSALGEVQKAGLDQPLPLKYTNEEAKARFIWQEIFMRGYERDAVWTHMGPLYIKLLKKVDPEKAEEQKRRYREMIERQGNYPEVLMIEKGEARLFHTPFYFCDQGMLWAANYLRL
jgi:hypothetical protein